MIVILDRNIQNEVSFKEILSSIILLSKTEESDLSNAVLDLRKPKKLKIKIK
jgi:hypothetical protein